MSGTCEFITHRRPKHVEISSNALTWTIELILHVLDGRRCCVFTRPRRPALRLPYDFTRPRHPALRLPYDLLNNNSLTFDLILHLEVLKLGHLNCFFRFWTAGDAVISQGPGAPRLGYHMISLGPGASPRLGYHMIWQEML